jgi:DNA repair photolyase
MSIELPVFKGRGANWNPTNRFETVDVVIDDAVHVDPQELPAPKTVFLRDSTQSIITTNDSPDVMIEASINPYRGCEHGCIYCFARPTHEYLGFSSGLDFESRIMVKLDAAKLLRAELMKKKWEPKSIAISGVTDCYQPVERSLRITRSCLEVLAEFRNPCGVITKNHLITRDIDLYRAMAEWKGCVTILSITTLDAELARVMEPRASSPRRRIEAVRELHDAGVPVGVMVAPVVPGLTDHEMPAILEAAAEAGACFAGMVPLRLPFALAPMFEQWLAQHFPLRKEKVLSRIRDIRGGKLNDGNFHTRMQGEGPFAEQLHAMFDLAKRRVGLDRPSPELSTASFRRPAGPQMTLW